MRRHFPSLLVAAVTVVVALPVAVSVQQAHEDGRSLPGKDWPLVGGDWTSARYSTLRQIDTRNVGKLGGAWMKDFGAGASTRATPVVKGGVMFIPAGALLHAIDAKTGATIWTWPPSATPEPGRSPRSPMTSISGEELPNVAGVAVGEGLVFMGLRDGRVVAVNQETGRLAWAERIGEVPRKKGETVSAPPIYARGRVFVGLANGDWAMRGRVVALDAKTGRKQWTFMTVPGPGEFGHDTWPKDSDIWMHGGAGVWLAGTVDTDLGMVYFATGNAVPMYGGEIRAGDNLFTASIVALDMASGKLRWHYQVVHHDLWDADIATPPVLYEAQIAGKPRKALAALRADGYFFFLDRQTGQPLFPVEERPVTQDKFLNTAATQPFPVGADSLLPGCADYKGKIPAPFVLDCTGFAPPSLNAHTIVAPGCANPACTRHTDGLQSANRLFLRTGYGPRGPRPPHQRRPMVPGDRSGQPGAPAVHRDRRGDRQPHEQDRLEEGSAARAARRQRTSHDRWRADVPCLRRRQRRSVRRPERRAALAVSNRRPHRARAVDHLRNRRRSIRGSRDGHRVVGLQAGRNRTAAAGSPRATRRRPAGRLKRSRQEPCCRCPSAVRSATATRWTSTPSTRSARV